jgi:GTP-binding protein EngB required for normal cell division
MKEKPSLLIIGNSNVGKSSITRLLLPNPKKFKGKVGKTPGSTLLINKVYQPSMDYQIVDLPGFGYMKHRSQRREEHIKKQIVIHLEKYHQKYFLGLIIINILRIEDEISKYFLMKKNTIPLTFELISFLKELEMPILVVINKIDKLSNFDVNRIISLFLTVSKEFGLNIIHLDNYLNQEKGEIPYLEFSATKKINLHKLKVIIKRYYSK